MKAPLTVLAMVCLILAACQSTTPASPTDKPILQQADLELWMNFLAGDALRGRKSGSKEGLLAAGYLAGQMEQMGLRPLPGQASFFIPFTYEREGELITDYNVVGYLKGSDPDMEHEFVMLGGHYDHVGVQQPINGDSIYNGADDDASGTVCMLGIAKLLAANPPSRSIVACAWAAEEMGLKGSMAFAANPPIALKNMVTMVNLELTGHAEKLGEGKVFMTGAQYSDLDDRVSDHLSAGGFELIDDPFPSFQLFYRSDNAPFTNLNQAKGDEVKRGIPAHSFSTWGGEEHYHQPSDDPSSINYDNMFGLIKALTPAVRDLANTPKMVAWTNEEFARYTGDDN